MLAMCQVKFYLLDFSQGPYEVVFVIISTSEKEELRLSVPTFPSPAQPQGLGHIMCLWFHFARIILFGALQGCIFLSSTTSSLRHNYEQDTYPP